jgi:glycosyltransferase involved in cell wall biosynthesis
VKTLHLDLGREMRGGQWQVLRLVRGLRVRGDKPMLLAREGGELLRRARAEGLNARPLRMLELLQLSRSFDLVHAHDARSHSAAALFHDAKPGHAPLVVSRRVAFPVRKGILSRRKYGRANAYIAVSKYAASVLADGGIPEHRIEVVYDGVPLLPKTESGTRVLAIASDDPLKGGELLRSLACGVEFSRNLEADLPTARVFVYITHSEGLGSAVLLAMSAGVPVIASEVGGIPEIIDNGVNGLLVGNTVAEIAAAIRQIHENPGEMSERGRAKVAAMFNEERMVENTVEVYRKVLDDV